MNIKEKENVRCNCPYYKSKHIHSKSRITKNLQKNKANTALDNLANILVNYNIPRALEIKVRLKYLENL